MLRYRHTDFDLFPLIRWENNFCPRKTSLPYLIRYYGAGALHLPQSSRAGWSCVARNPPPERSNPLSGENLIHQVRELRRNPRAHALCPAALAPLVSVPERLELPPGGKEHEGCTLSYSTAGKYHLHLGKTSLPALESSANVLQSSFQMKKEFTA